MALINGTDGNDVLNGTAENDEINGGLGDDLLRGFLGNDTIFGNGGRDIIVGGPGADNLVGAADLLSTLSYRDSFFGVKIDLQDPYSPTGGDAEGDFIGGFLFVDGSQDSDQISGSQEANRLSGFDGDDILTGREGADALLGGDGDDTLIGGEGADILNGGAGVDTAWFLNALTGVTADLLTPSGTTGDAAGDTYISVENISGTGFADTLLGDNAANTISGGLLDGSADILSGRGGDDTLQGVGGNDRLDGGTGADILEGGSGNDTYYVDNVGDKIVEGAGQGTADWVAASISYTLAAGVQAEKLSTTSSGATAAINLTGNEFAQAITGNAGANRLNGMGGADTMTGLGGNDTYYIDNAGDRVVEGAAQGTLDWVATSVTYGLGAGVHVEFLGTTSSGGTTAINISGNEFGQTIVGNAGANLLTGNGGNDTLTGGAGADMFFFDTALNASTNVDRITDFNVAADTVRLENGIFTQIVGTGTLSSAQFYSSAAGVAHDANDRIIYETDTGKLFYDSNGNAAGGSIQFAVLAAGLALTNADFLVV